ncbi:hypothetical protein [Methanobacterium sp. ACI-7]|uniref:hypothetical protein n=1 Tax=unclassified Methanobacterium TaxID=2627676 RepID=UPI0039C411D1
MQSQKISHIRWGIFVLPLAGLITALSLLLRGPLTLPNDNLLGFIKIASDPNFIPIWILLFLGSFLSVFGILALYGFLRYEMKDKTSLAAMVLSIAGLLFFIPTTGILTFSAPIVAELYIQGQTAAVQVISSTFASPITVGFLILSGILYTAGSILFALAIKRSKVISTIPGILFAIHGPLVTFGAATAYAGELLGGFLLLISGLWIAWSVWKYLK